MTLAYDGTLFHGWAAQPGLRTIEGEVSAALARIARRSVPLTVAGRTDAGVHAREQVVHFDMSTREWQRMNPRPGAIVRRLQGLLAQEYSALWRSESMMPRAKLETTSGSSDVVIHRVELVENTFDARFSALGRHYCYILADGQTLADPVMRRNQWWSAAQSLDVGKMNLAANSLLGEHNFLSFCRPREGATTIRTLRKLDVIRREDTTIEVRVSADAFCHSMVRSLVGALYEVGRGKRDQNWVQRLICQPSRQHGVPVAPAQGLTLEKIDYPAPGEWETRALAARNRRTQCC